MLILMAFLLFFSCISSTGSGFQDEVSQDSTISSESDGQVESPDGLPQAGLDPNGLVFLPAEFPSLPMAPGVGIITKEKRDFAASLSEKERNALSESYRAAYIDSMLQEQPLAGVLGGDMVHGWPEDNPHGWVQNWRSPVQAANSWGLPSLVLAVRGVIHSEMGQDRVFVVQGKVLDQYGKSAGVNYANGSVGYGSPRGHEFVYDGKLAQRFNLGLITVDLQGKSAFIQEEPPSLKIEPPPEVGVFKSNVGGTVSGSGTLDVGQDIKSAFIGAWKIAIDQGLKAMIPDGLGLYLSFPENSWVLTGVETLRGLYIQSFNRRSIVLVLPDLLLKTDDSQSPASQPIEASWPMFPRLIAAPFINLLLDPSKFSPPGSENLKPLDIKFSGADDFSRGLMKGLALYGIPLSDPVVVKKGEGTEAFWQLNQRFSRGWLSGRLHI